jgi:transcriptional regulator with XRE-family HTH domain
MAERTATVLGQVARDARHRLGLTQAEVAERVGLASEVYGRLERGAMLPSVPTLKRLCVALGISADGMLGVGRPAARQSAEPALTARKPQAYRLLMRRAADLDERALRILGELATLLRRGRLQ